MSQTISPKIKRRYGLKRVCEVWGVNRSGIYRLQGRSPIPPPGKRGPKPSVEDDELVKHIRADIQSSPFRGEGHRKVHARLKRKEINVSRNRVLRLMKSHGLLSPHRTRYRRPMTHDGRITTDGPNVMWGSDGTKVLTVDDGWVWIFSAAEHWNTECLGWHVCKQGDRFAALEPISQAVKRVFGCLEQGIASGLKLRIDNGSQYTSSYFLDALKHWGIEASFGLVRQPETNGVAERFHRTMKDQIIEGGNFKNIDEVREAVRKFVELYNREWLVAKLEYQSPLAARQNHSGLKRVA